VNGRVCCECLSQLTCRIFLISIGDSNIVSEILSPVGAANWVEQHVETLSNSETTKSGSGLQRGVNAPRQGKPPRRARSVHLAASTMLQFALGYPPGTSRLSILGSYRSSIPRSIGRIERRGKVAPRVPWHHLRQGRLQVASAEDKAQEKLTEKGGL
jgi:hypothetical protein